MRTFFKRLTSRGFACEDRDNTKTSQTTKDLSNHRTLPSDNTNRSRLHASGLRKQSPYVLLFLLLHSVAFGQDIITRTQITPDTAWVGQRMTLQIDVLGKDGWAQIADISDIEIDGCYLLPSGNSRVRLQEKIEGADYSGQRYELALYPQRDGKLLIPEIPLSIKVQTWGANAGTEEQVTHTQPNTINVRLPDGVQNVHSFVASPKFTATQTWSSDANDFTLGDALKRSIRLEAQDLPAMLLPTIEAPNLPLLSSYPESPELKDTTDRGTSTARRDETITYVFESNGTVELPSYTFQWWNTANETLQSITLPGKRIQLSGGSASNRSSTLTSDTVDANDSKQKFGLLLLALVAAGLSFFRWKYHCAHGNADADSEATQFKQLQTCARNSTTASAMLQLTITWIDTATDNTLTTTDFLNQFAHPDAQRHTAELLRNPSIEKPPLSNAQFIKYLKEARSRYRKAQASQSRIDQADRTLPPLNG